MQTVGLDPDFWKGRRVFVTGHTGFMGGWLCLWLHRLGARVTGYALAPPTRPGLFDTAGIAGIVDSVHGDVRDGGGLLAAIRDAGSDIVFHLAAQPLVRAAHARPVDTFAANVMGTVNLLEALRLLDGIAAAIIVTTDKVYENRETGQAYRETDTLGGHEPYGISKACAELAVEAYRQSYFADTAPAIATVRAGNIIGGGDWAADRIVPDAIAAFSQGLPLRLRNPHAVRPWQHVLEPLAGFLTLAQRLANDPEDTTGGWNFGPGPEATCTVAELVEGLAERWGDRALCVSEPDAGPREATLLHLDSSRAAETLGWRTRWSLARTHAATVEWYRAHIAGRDMRDLSLEQINAYCGAN